MSTGTFAMRLYLCPRVLCAPKGNGVPSGISAPSFRSVRLQT